MTASKQVIATDIYHPDAEQPFDGVNAYLAWCDDTGRPQGALVALLFYHGQLVEKNLDYSIK